jgi:hypothetical protein
MYIYIVYMHIYMYIYIVWLMLHLLNFMHLYSIFMYIYILWSTLRILNFMHLLFYIHVLLFYTFLHFCIQKLFILYNLHLYCKRRRPTPSTHVELPTHVYVEPDDAFVKPKLIVC